MYSTPVMHFAAHEMAVFDVPHGVPRHHVAQPQGTAYGTPKTLQTELTSRSSRVMQSHPGRMLRLDLISSGKGGKVA